MLRCRWRGHPDHKGDLTKEFGPSSSGKTIIIASTEGMSRFRIGRERVGLNVYRKK